VPVAFETMGPVGRFSFRLVKQLFFGSILTKIFSLSLYQLKGFQG
jgi:hypothetical protein